MKRLLGYGIVGIILLAGTITNVAEARTYPGQNGKIYYVNQGGASVGLDTESIWSVNPDGSSSTKFGTDGQTSPHLSSPSASKIAYLEWDSDASKLRLMIANQNGSNPAEIIIPSGVSFGSGMSGTKFTLSFASDTSLVFAAQNDSTSVIDIYRINVDGTGFTKITSSTDPVSDYYFAPIVSADGSRMLAMHVTGAGTDVVVLDMSGNVISTVVSNASLVPTGERPRYAWSPDGTQAVILSDVAFDERAVAVYNIASNGNATLAYNVEPSNIPTTGLVSIGATATGIFDVTFSPDGKYIGMIATGAGAAPGDDAHVWVISTSNPTGVARSVVTIGPQGEGSGIAGYIDWQALPIPTSPNKPSTPEDNTSAPNAPSTGVKPNDDHITPLTVLSTIILFGAAGIATVRYAYRSQK